MGFRVLDGPAQIKLPRTEDQSIFGDLDPPESVRLFDVEHDFLVDEQFVVERQINAIGIEGILGEWRDLDFRTQTSAYLFT